MNEPTSHWAKNGKIVLVLSTMKMKQYTHRGLKYEKKCNLGEPHCLYQSLKSTLFIL